jgi:RHS repeat-associated protein
VTRRYYPEGEAWVGVGRQLYYARDHVGSVRDAIEVGSGQRVASVDYDPYGNALNGGGKDGADFGFAGMLYHRDSGLYLTRNRAYDPRTARWLSRNPLEEAGGVNLYVFAFDNPLRPLGPIRVDSGSPPGSLNTSTPDSAGQGRAR